MDKVQTVFRLILGGALCGCLLGIPLGAILGTGLGFLVANNPSLGLDGALVGGALLGLAGALYGLALALTPIRAPDDLSGKREEREMTATRR